MPRKVAKNRSRVGLARRAGATGVALPRCGPTARMLVYIGIADGTSSARTQTCRHSKKGRLGWSFPTVRGARPRLNVCARAPCARLVTSRRGENAKTQGWAHPAGGRHAVAPPRRTTARMLVYIGIADGTSSVLMQMCRHSKKEKRKRLELANGAWRAPDSMSVRAPRARVWSHHVAGENAKTQGWGSPGGWAPRRRSAAAPDGTEHWLHGPHELIVHGTAGVGASAPSGWYAGADFFLGVRRGTAAWGTAPPGTRLEPAL